MMTQVVQGSIWSLSGQAATLMVSLVATPFVIRLLGTEAYGVFVLINVLIGYFAVVDLGMGQASIKFGAEAHARGDGRAEVEVFWTSLLVLSIPTVVTALLLALMAEALAEQVLRLPAYLCEQATVALRLAAIGFVARSVAGVLSSAQSIRLRIDLYALINTLAGIGQIALVPLAIAFRGGVVSAVLVVTGVNIGTAVAHGLVSLRLFTGLLRPHTSMSLVRPLLKFGIASAAMNLLWIALMNADKLLVVRLVSVRELAYYSVAFTLARLLSLLPAALNQSLFPALSRLYATREPRELQALYTQSLRGLVIWTLPTALGICLVAKPFLAIWAGLDYERESVLPLYVLLAGSVFDALSYVPRILLTAAGKPHLILYFQALNLLPYFVIFIALITRFGIVGGAVAWSLRAMIESALIFWAVKTRFGLSASVLPSRSSD
jgi:O-antigen/teichoic acid export membrane protein